MKRNVSVRSCLRIMSSSADRKARPRREVQVVKCPDIPPPTKRQGVVRPRSDIGADAGRDEKAMQDKVAERKEFRDIWKSVMELGASQFDNKEKKAYEARRIVELGGKAPKNQKVPYKILMGMLKKRKEREAKQEQMVKESGVVLGRKRAMPSIDSGRDEKRRRGGMEHDEYRLPGKLKRGTLYIDNRTAQTLSRPTGGASRRPRRNTGI